jgi:hypothetical protein
MADHHLALIDTFLLIRNLSSFIIIQWYIVVFKKLLENHYFMYATYFMLMNEDIIYRLSNKITDIFIIWI